MKRIARAAHRELESETARLTGCLCSAVDAARATVQYAANKGESLFFTPEDIRALGLSLYIRRREEKSSRDHGKTS